MKRQAWLLMVLLAAVAVHAQDFRKKMSRFVQQTIMEQTVPDKRAADTRQQILMAFVQVEQTNADEVLTAYGCKKYAQLNDICIAAIPLDRLTSLAQQPAILRIEANPCAEAQMDTTVKVANILPIYTVDAQHQAFTGKGVVVGLMDIGFDLTHPNFYDATGTRYRIQALWDMLSTDTIGSSFPVGRDYVGQEELLKHQHSVDSPTQTHGTLTLGCAAGSNYDTPYRGVAFESDLCLVSNAVGADSIYIAPEDRYKFTTAVDALGFKYLFDYADAQGKPCVASFSEGYTPYMDEEDQLYNDFLEQLCGSGHIIVASAGNAGWSYTYMEKPKGTEVAGAFIKSSQNNAVYRVKTDQPTTFSVWIYQETDGMPYVCRSYESTDEQMEDMLTDTLELGDKKLTVSIVRYPSAFDSSTYLAVLLSADEPLNQLPPIALTLSGTDCHAELFGSNSYTLTNNSIDTRWNAAQANHNIVAPGCFPSVICVGSTTHRKSYRTLDGQWHVSSFEPGIVSAFSSRGPTMSGNIKPDITAPGVNVLTSMNSHYAEQQQLNDSHMVAVSSFQGRDYPWCAETGTSLSTPVTAGTIALWLQAKPELTPQQIRDVMARSCRHPQPALSYPNNLYGHGELDGYRGLLDVLGITAIETISQHQPTRLHIVPQQGFLQLLFDQLPDDDILVRIYDISGSLLMEQRLLPSTLSVSIALPHTLHGLYAIQVNSSEPTLTGSELVRIP